MVIRDVSENNLPKDQRPIKLNIDINTYTIMCRYVIQPHSILRMEHLVNLRKLMSIIDYSTYENDPEKVKRVNFILKALEARLDENIQDQEIILNYINGGLTFQVDFLDYDNMYLSKDEILYIHKLISETLEYQFIYTSIDQIQEICARFKNSDYSNRGPIVKEFEGLVDNLKNNFRHCKVNDNTVDMEFSLREGVFNNVVSDVYQLITNPSRRLITGMQGINEMTGGGFESGRVYMLLGTSGVGKSITLLNLIYQMKRFNTNYKTKDPTKTPCIVLLTMENTVVETVTRLFDLVIENSMGMENYTLQEVLTMLRSQGELFLNDSSPIDIVIKYKPNKSIDTSWLYSMCDDLEDDGYEVICLVQDHVKRIRSIYQNSDLRLELGDITNELKVFAADKDIPVITNSHLNRDASRIIEDGERKQNQDIGKLLGKSNIGESMLMIDNLDCGIIITLDYDSDGNRYMAFNMVKMRTKTNRTYIAQPFYTNSTIRLVEDFGGIPQFKESIHANAELKRNTIVKISGSNSLISNSIDEVIDERMESENAFANKQLYELKEEDQQKKNPEIPIEFVSLNNGSGFSELLSEFEQSIEPDCPIEFLDGSEII